MAPDELPDGLVVADHRGRVVCFNRAAARLTGIRAADVLGAAVRQALPLRDPDGRRWWSRPTRTTACAIRTGQPEMSLLPDGPEVLVTARYVRDRARAERPAAAARSAAASGGQPARHASSAARRSAPAPS